MADDKDFVLKGLLQHNYFPTTRPGKEELPPIFTSEGFTPEVAMQLVAREREAKAKGRKGGYDQLEYRLTRYNSVSRLLSIPHPFAHAELCFELHEHWEKLAYISSNPNSQIKPYPHDDGRLIVMSGYGGRTGQSQRSLDRSFGKRYVVRTDIANCFPSIYSHAIPWALVGHEEAKSSRLKPEEWFNKLDKRFRASRRDETQGVAIGPGSSNIAAEIILGRVDEELRKSFSFIRYIDDYECYCDSEHQALDFVRQLEKLVAKFKLQLNARKTRISRLPQPVTEDWILELGQHIPKGDEPEIRDVYRFLDVAVCLADKNPDGSVLKYAASVVSGLKLSYPKNEACLNYLLGLAFHHSDLLPKLTGLIDSLLPEIFGHIMDFGGICPKIEAVLNECIELRRSDGMCWALYLLGRVRHELPEEMAKKLIDTDDALAILTLYWASDTHKQMAIDYANTLDQTDSHQLDRYWVLLYQLFLDGKIDNPYPAEKCFEVLRENGVSFMLPNNGVVPQAPEQDAEF
jgi:hypothetical protein